MALSLRHCLLFCPMVWIYFGITWTCSSLWLLFYLCFQWFCKLLRRSFGKQRQNSLTDITSRDNVDVGEYDVLEHEGTSSDLEETVAFNTSSNSFQGALLCPCTKSKSLPICIPRRMKPKKEGYDAFRTSSMCSTLDAKDEYHPQTLEKLMRSISEDNISVLTVSSSSEPSLMFSMSPIQ